MTSHRRDRVQENRMMGAVMRATGWYCYGVAAVEISNALNLRSEL